MADRGKPLPVTFVTDVNIDLYQRHPRQESQQRVDEIKGRSLHAPVATAENAGIHAKFVNKVQDPRGRCHPRGARVAP